MVAWFKYKTTLATYAFFSGIVMRLIVANSNSSCNGSTEEEKIIEVQQYPDFISEGNDAIIYWTYCKANVTSITGFIVFREFRLNRYKKMYLLSMDLSGKISFTRNKDHILWNRIYLMGNDHQISFTIKNVSTNDSGFYRLEIRREGHGDLYSRVKMIVKPLYILTNERSATTGIVKRPAVKLTNTTKTNENNNTMGQSGNQGNSNITILWATLVPSVLVIVLLSFGILILIMYIKKGKEREGQENLINTAENTV